MEGLRLALLGILSCPEMSAIAGILPVDQGAPHPEERVKTLRTMGFVVAPLQTTRLASDTLNSHKFNVGTADARDAIERSDLCKVDLIDSGASSADASRHLPSLLSGMPPAATQQPPEVPLVMVVETTDKTPIKSSTLAGERYIPPNELQNPELETANSEALAPQPARPVQHRGRYLRRAFWGFLLLCALLGVVSQLGDSPNHIATGILSIPYFIFALTVMWVFFKQGEPHLASYIVDRVAALSRRVRESAAASCNRAASFSRRMRQV